MAKFEFALAILALLLVLLTSSCPAQKITKKITDLGFRVDLIRINRFNARQEVLETTLRSSKARAAKTTELTRVSVYQNHLEFLLNMTIGTPPQHINGIVDTGSDLIWIQCKACKKCIPELSPLFNPSHSTSFSNIPCTNRLCVSLPSSTCEPNCNYTYRYADKTRTSGFLGTDTLTLTLASNRKKASFPHIGFGCGLNNTGSLGDSSGIIGFGRGPLSLISQLGIRAFSYCLNFKSSRSPLFFGSSAQLTGSDIQSTPLLQFNSDSHYYLFLKGITVGTTLLPIPPEAFEVNNRKGGMMMIDSGTPALLLVPEAFEPLLEAMKSQVALPVRDARDTPFELCFESETVDVDMPDLTLHLEDADWVIPKDTYIAFDEPRKSLCILFRKDPSGNILGSLMTQDMHILYDVENEKLSFKPQKCDEL